jgi:tetratricopeptide (TPR) repeat protein
MILNQKRKLFLVTSAIFLLLFLFYKWQIATSNYYLDKGNNVYDAKNFNEALKNYKYAAAINGNRDIIYEAKIKRAEIFYCHWQLNKAEKELLEAVNERRNDYRVHELLGDVYLAKREFEKSTENYNLAIELNNKKRITIKLAKCFVANQELDLAFNMLLNLQKEDLKNDNKQNYDEEILYYLGLINLSGNVSYNDYLKSIENSGIYKEKITEIKKVIEIYNNKKISNYSDAIIADLYNKIGEPHFAISKINKVIKNNPNYRDAWIISGKSNFIIGDYKKSLADFNKALALDSNNPEIHFWIASIYRKTENNLEAEKFFGKYEKLK